jgi:hypothetical protein
MAWRKSKTESRDGARVCLRDGRAADCRELALEARKDEAMLMMGTLGRRVV